MIIKHDGNCFYAETKDKDETIRFEGRERLAREVLKRTGFLWNYEKNRPWCWSTKRAPYVAPLIAFCDPSARAHLGDVVKALRDSAAAEVKGEVSIPVPEGRELYPYQQAGIQFLIDRPAAILADQPGVGKTAQCVALINALGEEVNNALIVCPASLKTNWMRELQMWLVRDLEYAVAASKGFPLTPIVVTNYDVLHKFREDIKERSPWDLIVADEAHMVKSPDAQRSKAFYSIPAKRCVLVTGTPLLNRPIELFPLLHRVDPKNWKSKFAYAKEFCLPPEAPILMADLTEKPIRDIEVGDRVVGWERKNVQRRLCDAEVLAVLKKRSELQRVTLYDGTVLVCTPDHKWLNGVVGSPSSGFEYLPAKAGTVCGRGRNRATRIAHILSSPTPLYSGADYELGYVMGFFRGDGWCSKRVRTTVKEFAFKERCHPETVDTDYVIGAACVDIDPLERCVDILKRRGMNPGIYQSELRRCHMVFSIQKIGGIDKAIAWDFFNQQNPDTDDWWAGFLGGIYDAEGFGQTIAQYLDVNPVTFKMIESALGRFGFPYRIAPNRKVIRILGGRQTMLRFWSIASPSLSRKLKAYIYNGGGKFMGNSSLVKSIEPIEGEHDVYTLTTSTGNYTAYGVGSKNCGMRHNGYGYDFSGASNLERLNFLLRAGPRSDGAPPGFMIRRLKSEVLKDLPPKVRQVIELPSNGAQGAISEELDEYRGHQARMKALRAAVRAAKASKSEMRYREAVDALRAGSAASFTQLAKKRYNTAIAKLPYVCDYIDQTLQDSDTKLVLFAHHRDAITYLQRTFPDVSVVLTGETTLAKRQEAIDRFQKDAKVQLFIGSLTAAGLGITLTASSHVAFAELDWVPANVTQGEDRCHRVGQKDSVLVTHLVLEGSLDAYMAKKLVRKQAVIDRALGDEKKRLEMEEIDGDDEESRAGRDDDHLLELR